MNKKGELRLQHIIIALLVTSLFGVFMFTSTNNFLSEHTNLSESDLIDEGEEGNTTRFFSSINKINNMTGDLMGDSKLAPGGIESALETDEGDAEGSIIKSGYKFISSIGYWIFKYPSAMISAFFTFMGLPQEFANVTTTILIIIVVIILISSILKNRL